MKVWPLFCAIFIFTLLSTSAFAVSDSILITLPNKETKFSLKDLKSKLKVVTIIIDDPVYKKRKSYDGVRLLDVLKLAGFKENTTNDEIIFTAKDGYSPNTSFESLRLHTAILVFGEHGKKEFEFEKIEQGKAIISPAPYYVVWEEGNKLDKEIPWPYQLVKIEIVNFRQKYEKLYPKNVAADSAVMKGFLTFKNQCLRCHSINLQGGDLGPELNAPQNITEYWSKENLKRFIHDSSSFRYKSKMPPFPNLKDTEINDILEYFEYMKGFKLK